MESDEELTSFVARVEAALTPGFSEVLSEETRKTQRALMILSFLLLLVALGAIQFSGNVEFAGLKFAGVTAKNTTVLLGTAVCIYLEALVGIRCYSELHLWQLKSEVGRLNTTLIAQDVDFLRTAIQKDLAAVTTEKRPDD